MNDTRLPELLVVCLCAEWCGTCREYRPGFEALAQQWPDAGFHWVDVEEGAEGIEDLEVENFPTLLIQRGETVLFFGPMLPQQGHLQRTLEILAAFDEGQAQSYAHATAERRAWQAAAGVRAALHRRAAGDGR